MVLFFPLQNKHIISAYIHFILGCTWGFSVIECRGVSSCLPGDSCELPTSWLDNKLLPAEKNVQPIQAVKLFVAIAFDIIVVC